MLTIILIKLADIITIILFLAATILLIHYLKGLFGLD